MAEDVSPGSSPEATALMAKVQQVYREVHSFHSIVEIVHEQETTLSDPSAEATLEPLIRMETWFDRPNARTEITVGIGDYGATNIFIGDKQFWYTNFQERWTKKERVVDPLTDGFFATFSKIPVDVFTALSEQTLEGRAVWVAEGISREEDSDSLSTRTTWWIDQRTNLVQQVRMESSLAKKGSEAVPLDITTFKCRIFEPEIEISSERFAVPPDVPLGEPTPYIPPIFGSDKIGKLIFHGMRRFLNKYSASPKPRYF